MQKMMTVTTQSLNGITFDGSDLWVSDVLERKMKKVSIHEQKILREIKFVLGGIPRAMTFANDSLLVLNFDEEKQVCPELVQINVMNGKTLRTLQCPPEVDSGIAFDNTNFWASSSIHNHILKFSPGSGEVLCRIETPAPVTALTFTGNFLVYVLLREGEKSSIVVWDPRKECSVKEVDWKAMVGGICHAEDMLFLTNSLSKELCVTKIKLD